MNPRNPASAKIPFHYRIMRDRRVRHAKTPFLTGLKVPAKFGEALWNLDWVLGKTSTFKGRGAGSTATSNFRSPHRRPVLKGVWVLCEGIRCIFVKASQSGAHLSGIQPEKRPWG